MRLHYFLIFCILLLFSCEQDAFFEVKDGHTKLYAFSEITTDDKIKVVVNLAPGLNTEDQYFYPKQSDAQVVLFENGVPLENPGFRYIAREKAFVSQGAFRPEPNVEYSLEVSLKNDTEIQPIYGTTSIPTQNFIEDYIVNEYLTSQVNKNFKEIEINMTVPFANAENEYFLLKPCYINSAGEVERLLVKETSNSNSGAYYSNFNKGLLIDRSKFEGDLQLSLVNDALVRVEDEVKQILIEVRTITPEAYQYYKSFSKQVVSQSVSLSEPVISYSNFENGLGLFTGYASTQNVVELY